MFMIVCTICGYLAVTLLFTVAPALRPSRRYAIIAAVAVLVPTLAYLIGGLGFGAYTGSFGTILAFIGVGALYVFVIGLITRLLQVLIGPPALFVALAIFVFLNIPSLGATYTAKVLARLLALPQPLLDRGGNTNAERSILYFGGLGVGTDLLKLLAWTGVIVLLLLLPVSRKLDANGNTRSSPGASGRRRRGSRNSPEGGHRAHRARRARDASDPARGPGVFAVISAPPMNLLGPNWSAIWSRSSSAPRATGQSGCWCSRAATRITSSLTWT